MKYFRIAFISIFLVIVITAVISLFLPSEYTVSREIIIKTPVEKIESYILDLKKWEYWSVWNQENDSTATFTFSGNEKGVGAIFSWEGDIYGKGKIEITEYIPTAKIRYMLYLNEGEFTHDATLTFKSNMKGTQVKWEINGELSWNPAHKIFGLFMDDFMGPDLENGLKKLKDRCETEIPDM